MKETAKLINVIRRIARSAGYAAWNKGDPQAARFCVGQYNRVLARLTELEPNIKTLFAPLPADASPDVTRIAARALAAYLSADDGEPEAWAFAWRAGRFRSSGRCIPISIRCW